jgi:DeoR/GlpR family transcriptional regulator of sugar metabolism
MLTSEKLETLAPFRIGSIADINHLVVEHNAPARIVSALKRDGAKILIADAPAAGHSTRSLKFS